MQTQPQADTPVLRTSGSEATENSTSIRPRYHLLDIIRAVAVISMVIYHAVWDGVYIFGWDLPFFRTQAAFYWQQTTCITFLLLSGFCLQLGRHKIKRALTVLICSGIIWIVTEIAMPASAVRFGVLTLIGSAMLLMSLAERYIKRLNPWVSLAVCLVCFALTRYLKNGWLGFFRIPLVKMPSFLYSGGALSAYLGFMPEGFYSSDYFPLIPWIFVFAAGCFLYLIFERRSWLRYLEGPSCKALELVGRKALWIYMAHQALIYGVLYLIHEIILK